MAASFENLPNDPSDDQVTKINGQVIVDEASGLPSNSQKVTSNGVAASDPASSGANPLDIVICGAGIGGLSAAIGLRSQGHRVVIYERSSGDNEVGAAIHLAPNCNGILRRFGIFPESFGANPMDSFAEYDDKGNLKFRSDLIEKNKIWQHPWQLCNRVRLHRALHDAAVNPNQSGIPVTIVYNSKVVEVDSSAGEVKLQDGTLVKGDLIIGADGVHSYTRASLMGKPVKAFPSGKSAYRFLIPRKQALEDEKTHKYTKQDNELVMWFGSDRRVVMYPCDDNSMLNFVCIHPDKDTNGSGEDWGKGGSVAEVLATYENFAPDLLRLLAKADPTSVKSWKLLDMEKLPKWASGKLALLGDAAHPFLPHQGQGGGVAIEDAASLSVVFPMGTRPDEILDRVKLYEQIRYERAHKIQEYSRQAGLDAVGGKPKIDSEFNPTPSLFDPRLKSIVQAYTNYNFGHDEWHHSTNAFRKWQWAKNPQMYYRMPVAFGPAVGPRQDFFGKSRPSGHSTFVTAAVKFKTSRTFLQSLFPTEKFSFISPGTLAYASFSTTTLGKMDWLGGGGYNHLGLYIHGCRYTKANGDVVDGTYLPLLFESLTDPILTGRDELGMPKIYCAIDIHRRSNSWRMQASWQGAVFGNIALEGLEQIDPTSESGTFGGEADKGIMAYKYIPKVGVRGEADCEYPIFVDHGAEAKNIPSTVTSTAKATTAKINWDSMDWEALPTLHHIVSTLAEIPIYEIVGAKVVEGLGVPDVSSARRIE